MKNLKNKKQNHTSQKGITLIALIITIIVMLILVGVTISVALNGGLFGKGEKAAFQTKVSTIKEQLEMEKAARTMENGGKKLEDYSEITVAGLQGLDQKTRDEYNGKIVVDEDGNICYDLSKVTDEEERAWLEEIGIYAYTGKKVETYTFTIGELAERGLIPLTEPEREEDVMLSYEEFFLTTVSEELKNSTITGMLGETEVLTYNITCSNPNYSNIFDLEDQSGPPNTYWLYIMEDSIFFLVINENEEIITMENYESYKDLTFTISKSENTDVGGTKPPTSEKGTFAYGTEETFFIVFLDSNEIMAVSDGSISMEKAKYKAYENITDISESENWTNKDSSLNGYMFLDIEGDNSGTCFAIKSDNSKVAMVQFDHSNNRIYRNSGWTFEKNTNIDISPYL